MLETQIVKAGGLDKDSVRKVTPVTKEDLL